MKAKKQEFLAIDIYTIDTLRSIDLLDALACQLNKVHLTRQERMKVIKALRLVKDYDRYVDDAYDEKYTELYYELMYIADKYCAPYTYYGSSEGDGACIGVWISTASIEEDICEKDLLKIDNVPKLYSGLAIDINDHGSMTLYQYINGRSREIWAVV